MLVSYRLVERVPVSITLYSYVSTFLIGCVQLQLKAMSPAMCGPKLCVSNKLCELHAGGARLARPSASYCIKVLGSSLGRQPEGWLGSWTRPTSHRRHVKAAETVKFWLAQLKSSYPLTSKPLWRSTACRLPVTAHVGTFAMPTSKRSVTAPEMLRKLQTCSRAVPGRRRQGLGGKLS